MWGAVDGTADRCAIGFVASDVDALPASIRTFADATVVIVALGGVCGFCRHGVTPFCVPAVGWLLMGIL